MKQLAAGVLLALLLACAAQAAPFVGFAGDGVFAGRKGMFGGRLPADDVSPYLDGVLDSVVFEIDATVADSYSGSGTTWANLIAAPADGSEQTDYDFFTGDGATSTTYPAFNGTAGDAAAYWSFDGGDYFDIKSGANTTFLKSLHKTTGGGDWWFAIALQTPDDANSDGIFTTRAGSTSVGVGVALGGSTETIQALQRGDTGNGTAVSTATVPVTTDSIVIVSYDTSAGEISYWVNTGTAETEAVTFNATSTDATQALRIGQYWAAGGTLPTGNRIYSIAMGNSYMTDADAAVIFANWEARHGRDYTP